MEDREAAKGALKRGARPTWILLTDQSVCRACTTRLPLSADSREEAARRGGSLECKLWLSLKNVNIISMLYENTSMSWASLCSAVPADVATRSRLDHDLHLRR